jgi:hypothetical protein
MRSPRALGPWLAAASLLGTPLIATPLIATVARAQTRDFDLERFSPAPDGDGFLSLPGTRTPGPWRWNVGLSLSYAREPLIVNDPATRGIVSDRLDGNLYFQLGILGQIAVVVNAPVALWQSGAPERLDGGQPLAVAAIRDPRVAVRVRLLGEDATVERDRHEGEGLALQVAGTLPLGQQGAFAGEGSPQLDGAILGDFHLMDFGIGGMLGFRHRFAEPSLLGSSFRNQLFAVIGVQIPLFFVDHVVAIAETDLTTDAEKPFGDSGSTAAEWRLGFRVSAIRDVELTAAAGSGFVGGAGSPLVRAIVGVSFAPRVHDRDHDGVVDDQDGCQTLPEDFDEHDDGDGCPEPDNDGDLVPDLDDRCPNERAEAGRDDDDDGCTDPVVDTDGDGIEDRADRCPAVAEDRDEHADDDGCPDPDDDDDAVPDVRDRCSREAEDRDGFEDSDGCPDPDDDGDGILDEADACPRVPEDRDGTEDEDGCVDLDDDHDGVPDAADQCRDTAETINGVTDEDGCPDRGGRALWATPPAARARPGAPPAPPAPPTWTGTLRIARDGTLAPASAPAIAQLARVVIADAPQRHVLDVGAPEGADALIAAIDAQLRAALAAAGGPGLSVTVRRSAELPRGRARLTRLLEAGAVVSSPAAREALEGAAPHPAATLSGPGPSSR